MIPVRVALRGFMSYRDEAELVFDGAPLWVLAGRNGAGKSAIFDAITFALYGVHRGGARDAKALVNHASSGLDVEFDFRAGEDDYRVKRTLSKKGNPTVQAFHLAGPHAPEPGAVGPQPVPETDMRAGFDAWVLRTVGLDARTFTASVLLQQGRSEALLEADPKVRHEMLAQIIDLSAYERLHERAEREQKEGRALADACRAQLDGLAPVDDGEVERLAGEAERAAAEAASAQEALERLAALRVHTEQWTRLEAERAEIERARGEAAALLDRAAEIERAAARRAELDRAVPLLERLLGEHLALAEAEAERDRGAREAAEAAEQLARAREELERAKAEEARLREEVDRLRAERDRARDEARELEPRVEKVERLERAREELAGLDRRLEAYPASLDEEVRRLEREEQVLVELIGAVPWLQVAADARGALVAAEAERDEAARRASDLEKRIAADSARAAGLDGAAREAAEAAEAAARRAAEDRALLGEARRRVERLGEVDGEAACRYCGQPLTAEHLDAERERLRADLERAERAARESGASEASAAERAAAAAADSRAAERALDALRSAAGAAKRDAERAGDAARRTGKRLAEAGRSLPERFASGLGANGFPTAEEIRSLRERAEGFEAHRGALEQARERALERHRVAGERKPRAAEVAALEAEYPDGAARDLRARYRRAGDEAERAARDLDDAGSRLETAPHAVLEAGLVVTRADERHREASLRGAADAARAEGLARSVAQARGELRGEWRGEAASLTRERLEALRDELGALAEATAMLERLEAARRAGGEREARLRAIELEAARMPEGARRPLEEIASEERAERERLRVAGEHRRVADEGRRALEARRARRAELERQLLESSRRESLYRELARLLGRDRLQRHLLQRAEAAIVSNANEALDRLSSGTIWLELKAGERGAGAPKALDLVAYNSQTSDDPIPVALLSGSQRFRVAVSLALAIGRYAAHGGRRIESVIIDEGFGSLDREGRREMVDELNALKSTLERIILVSHQEEFSDAFPNRYLVELVDGSSRVSLASDV